MGFNNVEPLKERVVGKLKVEIQQTEDEMGKAAARFVAKKMAVKI